MGKHPNMLSQDLKENEASKQTRDVDFELPPMNSEFWN